LLQHLQELDETDQIEAKAGSAAGEAVMSSVSSFSNEPQGKGGYIIFGVRKATADHNDRYEVVGVKDPDKLTNDFTTQCTGMLNKAVRPEIQTFTDPTTGRVLVAAYIPEASEHQKPIYIKKVGIPKGAYRRISGHDVQCNDEDMELLFRRGGTTTYDEAIVPESSFGDLDPAAFEAYRRMRSDPDAPELSLSDHDLARAIAAVKPTGSTFTPTVAGLVLFGHRASLRRLFPMLRIEYIQVPSTVWSGSTDGFTAIELLEGLLLSVPRVYQSVIGDIPRSFRLSAGSIVREDTPLVPARAIREAIVNAVMHRNYKTRQPTQIVRFSDRIEIRNPGSSLLPDDKLGGSSSVTRNEKIAAVLHDTRLAENKGLGISTMRTLVEKAGLLPPSFRSDHAKDEFLASFGLQHFFETSDLQWLGQFRRYSLTDDQSKALVLVRRTGAISNSEYRSLNHVETLVASQRLREMRDLGLLILHGAGSTTTYRPGPAFTKPTTGRSLINSPRGSRRDRSAVVSGLPADIIASISELKKPSARAEVEALILRILTIKPLSQAQLGLLLNRSSQAITPAIRELLERGVIERTYDDPRHPFQSLSIVIEPREIDMGLPPQSSLFDLLPE